MKFFAEQPPAPDSGHIDDSAGGNDEERTPGTPDVGTATAERIQKNEIPSRLSKIEGQIRGLRNMTVDGRECADLLTQVAAVRAALKKIADIMLASQVQRWLDETSDQGESDLDLEALLTAYYRHYRQSPVREVREQRQSPGKPMTERNGAGIADEETRTSLERKLFGIEAQVHGVRNMVLDGRADVDIVVQISAVRAGLKEVGDALVAAHVHRWLRNAHQNRGSTHLKADALLKIFRQYYR